MDAYPIFAIAACGAAPLTLRRWLGQQRSTIQLELLGNSYAALRMDDITSALHAILPDIICMLPEGAVRELDSEYFRDEERMACWAALLCGTNASDSSDINIGQGCTSLAQCLEGACACHRSLGQWKAMGRVPPAQRHCALASLSSTCEVQRSRAYRATESLRHAFRSDFNAGRWTSAAQALLCLSLGLPLPLPAHQDALMTTGTGTGTGTGTLPRGRIAGVIRRGIRTIIRASIAAKAMRELAAVPVANVLVRARARLVQGEGHARARLVQGEGHARARLVQGEGAGVLAKGWSQAQESGEQTGDPAATAAARRMDASSAAREGALLLRLWRAGCRQDSPPPCTVSAAEEQANNGAPGSAPLPVPVPVPAIMRCPSSAGWEMLGFQRFDCAPDFRSLGRLGLLGLAVFWEQRRGWARLHSSRETLPTRGFPLSAALLSVLHWCVRGARQDSAPAGKGSSELYRPALDGLFVDWGLEGGGAEGQWVGASPQVLEVVRTAMGVQCAVGGDMDRAPDSEPKSSSQGEHGDKDEDEDEDDMEDLFGPSGSKASTLRHEREDDPEGDAGQGLRRRGRRRRRASRGVFREQRDEMVALEPGVRADTVPPMGRPSSSRVSRAREPAGEGGPLPPLDRRDTEVHCIAAVLELFLRLGTDLIQRWWRPRTLDPPLLLEEEEGKKGGGGGVRAGWGPAAGRLPGPEEEPAYMQFGPVLEQLQRRWVRILRRDGVDGLFRLGHEMGNAAARGSGSGGARARTKRGVAGYEPRGNVV